jgi:hypothetical protein
MTEEIINRTMQVFLYTGGIVAFWQITKHMPKVLFTLIECIFFMSLSVACITPVTGIIEWIIAGNIDISMLFMGGCAGVSFLCVVWLTMAQLTRCWQGKKQHKFYMM